MGGHDRLGTRRDRPFDRIEIQVATEEFHLDKYRSCAHFGDHIRPGKKGLGGSDHLVAGADTAELQCHFQCRRCGIEYTHRTLIEISG